MYDKPKNFDLIIVMMSGGKDSVACLCHLLDIGIPKEKIELWHHDIDGREGSSLMDWPVTRAYVTALAKAFELPLYFSWKQGGFEREMLRHNTKTAPNFYETPEGLKSSGGVRGKDSTRRKFPQVSADLSVRWCSAYLKIDVCSAAIANQSRFDGKRIYVVTGERAEESAARAKYEVLEPHKTSCGRRTVMQWRPVKHWKREQVWDALRRYKINPHPAYRLGWGRVSCMTCIFGSCNQWASIKQIAPARVNKIGDYESGFGLTINRKKTVHQLAAAGKAYDMQPEDIRAALSETFDEPIFVDDWKLPAGAFGESCGPT